MKYIDILPVIIISLVGAITDIRYGRVKNKHLLFVITIWIGYSIINAVALKRNTFSLHWGINLALAVLASVLFYLSDVWAPGDCKLYCAIALMFPMYLYPDRVNNIFPALDFVIYAFATGYIVLLGTSIFSNRKDKNSIALDKKSLYLSAGRLISVATSVGVMTALHTVLATLFGEFYEANQILCSLVIIGVICLLQNKSKDIKVILGVLGLVFLFVWTILRKTWYNSLISLLLCLLLSVVIDLINDSARTNTYRVINGDEVKPGMILSYTTVMSMQWCIDPNIPRTTTENRRSRITVQQAEAVKTWCRNAKSNIVIVEMIPFAPSIALAVVIELIRNFK